MKKKFIISCSVLIIVSLTLTACNLGSRLSTSSTAEANNAYTGAATTALTEALAATGNCLVGTWSLTDFGPYMDSIKQNLSAKSNNNFTFSNGAFSGSATFVFNADNTVTLKMDNFTQNITMSMKVKESTVDIPMILTVNGSSSSDYSVDGDKISFSNQNPGDMKISIDTNGTVSTMDQNMFGEPGTQKLYQFSCSDTNTLSLKVIAVESMDLAPLILTRVP